jgi:hypothetical protein
VRSYEHRYRFYREVIARGITNHRPHLHVRHSGLQELNSELALFDPEAVISSQPLSVDPTGGGYRVAWVELPVEPSCAAGMRYGVYETQEEAERVFDGISNALQQNSPLRVVVSHADRVFLVPAGRVHYVVCQEAERPRNSD